MKKFSLSEKDRKHLASVIQQIEQKTSGELRLVLVRRSSPLGPVLVEAWLMLIILILFVFLSFRLELALDFRWWWILGAMVGTMPAGWFVSKWPWLQRRLLTQDEINQSVNQRAELEFYREGLGKTEAKTGVLLFLSLFEKRAIVLADKGIHQKIEQAEWEKVVAMIVGAGRDGRWCQHLEEALRECGSLLIQHFPAVAGDRNELSNEIVIKD